MRKQQGGFTLIEVLMVVLIVGIMGLLVVINSPDRRESDSAEETARTFYLKFQHAREQALLRNWVLGVEFKDDGYRFMRWQGDRWTVIDEGPLREVTLDSELQLDFIPGDFRLLDNITEGRTDVFREDDRDRQRGDDAPPRPDVFIFESTEFIPFRMQLISYRRSDISWQVDGRDGIQLRLGEGELW